MPYNQNNNSLVIEPQNGIGEYPNTPIPNTEYPNSDLAFDDLIERQPGWLLNSGIILLFGTVVVAVVLASFIRYPDKLAVPCLLTTENPPIDVVTLSGGQIAHWYVADGQSVGKGEVLAYIDNAARLEDVEAFAAFVEEVVNTAHIPDHLNLHLPDGFQMGELRTTYITYLQALSSFQHLLQQRIVFQKMNTLQDKTGKHQQLGEAMQRQLQLFEKELALAEKDHHRNLTLNGQGVVSDLDLEKNEAQLLQKQQQLENLKSNIIQNKIAIEQLNTEWLELKDARSTSVDDYLIRLEELALQFRNEHSDWENRYKVTAPITGTVAIAPSMVEKRTVNIGEAIAGVIPENAGDKIVARLSPPASGFGKMEVGNRALLQLDAYPHKEFGAVEVAISGISLLPVQNAEGGLVYDVTCEVPQPITSSTQKVLPFRQKLTGTAQVITKDRSIMERIVEGLLSVQN